MESLSRRCLAIDHRHHRTLTTLTVPTLHCAKCRSTAQHSHAVISINVGVIASSSFFPTSEMSYGSVDFGSVLASRRAGARKCAEGVNPLGRDHVFFSEG